LSEVESRESELASVAEALRRRGESLVQLEEELTERDRRLERLASELERRNHDLTRRETEASRVEEVRPAPAAREFDLDDDADGGVTAWLERRRTRLAQLDARQGELERRETDARHLEDRLASLESSLVRKEADLSAFAELLQQSLSRMETAGGNESGEPLIPADQDPTQRLRFWTRDSSNGGP
jgi:chromosome segregation protein